MCNHLNREAAMVVLDEGTVERHHRDGVWCDPCLVPLVDALNAGGVRTVASCCGHGAALGSIVLTDGRWLVICATDEEFHRVVPGRPADGDWPSPTCSQDCPCRADRIEADHV